MRYKYNMGFFQKIFPFTSEPARVGFAILGANQTIPPKRGTSELLRAFSNSPTLAGVVSAIANDIAANELILYNVKGKEPVPVAVNPIMDLLYTPASGLAGSQKLWLVQLWLDLVGEAGLVKQYSDSGKLINLWPLPPAWVQDRSITPDKPYRVHPANGGAFDIPFDDVIWFHRPDPYNPVGRGTGIGGTLNDEIEISELSSATIKRWFLNGGKPDVLIAGEGLSRNDTETLEQKWAERHGGFFKRYLPAFLGGANIQVHQLSSNFNDLQLSQLRQDERRVIQQTYGVPAEILGDALNSNRATITAASRIYGRRVLIPRLRLLLEVLNYQLVKPMMPGHELRYTNPVEEDRDFKLSVYQAAPFAFRVDEWRVLAGDEPLPDDEGQVFMVSPTLMPVSSPSEEIDYINAPEPQAEKSFKAVKKITMSEIDKALDKHPMQPVILPQVAEIVKFYGEDTTDEFKTTKANEDTFDFTDPKIRAFLKKEAAEYIKGIEDTTRAQIKKVLDVAEVEHWTIDEIASRVEDVMDIGDRSRSWTIARTETVRAANFGNHEGGRQLGIEQKEWLASIDGRERDEHRELSGQAPIPYNEAFKVDGESAMYPGDFGVAALDINCRCTLLPVPGEKSYYDTVEKRSARFTKHDRQRARFELKMRRDVRKTFAQQKKAVLAAIRKG
jgi:SPP1 gp7 family putative phage head morphogenesis protein